MKLLVADDDPLSRTMVSAMSKQWGFQPIEVADGAQAWQVLNQDAPPQLLLIDWVMPELNGLELCEKLCAQPPNHPYYLILLTAKDGVSDIVEGLNSGAHDYICKPFELQELRARLNVGKRMLETQRELIDAQVTLERERSAIENIVLRMRSSDQFYAENIRHILSSVEKTAGDIALSALSPDGTQHLMLGDFTGHGLTAAVGGPAVADIFYSLAAKQTSMATMIDKINSYVYEKLPTNMFLAAILVELSPHHDKVRVWNCGMHDLLIYHGDQLQLRVHSGNPALGIMKAPPDESAELGLLPGDKLYLYTDGIIEASDGRTMFGQLRLEQTIQLMLQQQGQLENIMQSLHEFCKDEDPLDDITLVELSC